MNSLCGFQALLTRVAKTGEGAVELLRCGLVAQLIECQVFDMIPDSDAHRYRCRRGSRVMSQNITDDFTKALDFDQVCP